MPIKVTCQCGKSFAAKDELAGKAVKCPNCQKPLRIPGAAAKPAAPKPAAPKPATPKAAAKPAAKPAPKPAAKPASASSSGIGIGEESQSFGLSDSALSEVGLTKQAANTRPCPGCTAPLALDAVICIKCGFNTNLGRRMETIKVSGQGGPAGHNAVTAELMERAANTIDDDAAEEKKKTGEGVPWWGYLAALLGVVGFMVMMMVLPQKVALLTGGIILYGAAICINFYAAIRIIVIAFTESAVQGALVLVGNFVCPIYNLYYIITRWDQCGTYFLMLLGTNVVANLVWFSLQAILGAMGDGTEEQSYIPPDRPAAVAAFGGERTLSPPAWKAWAPQSAALRPFAAGQAAA